MYRNNSDETFTNVAESVGLTGLRWLGIWWDYDNDGDWDVVSQNSADNTLALLQNAGGTFSRVSGAFSPSWIPGSSIGLGDYNNDGWLDVFMTNGSSGGRLLRNVGNGTFAEVAAGLFGNPERGIGWADMDNDGDVDVVAGGDVVKLYRNELNNGHHWLLVNLVGDASPREGLGAEVRVYAGGLVRLRQPGAEGHGWEGKNDLRVHVGLGTSAALDSVVVDWPSGTHQVLTGQAVDQILTVTEPEKRFRDVAATAGLSDEGVGSGVAWADYDGDGDLDLYLNKWGEINTSQDLKVNRLYKNNGAGIFSEIGASAGVANDKKSGGAAWGDYDGDGDLDLYVVNQDAANVLYRNEGNDQFTEVGGAAGVAESTAQGDLGWADYDRDGDLDLYVTSITPSPANSNLLYRNNGDGTFNNVAASAGVQNGAGGGVSWADYDDDGALDLYVSNGGSPNLLYHNRGDGIFEEVGSTAGVADAVLFAVAIWADYDGDGDVDLYTTRNGANLLYRNRGDGTFEEVGGTAGVAGNEDGEAGAGWADYDGDGDVDLYVSVSGVPPKSHRLYRNEGNGSFVEVAADEGVTYDGDGRSIGWADYDGDGDVDLYVSGDFNDAPPRLYRNEGGVGSWLAVKLQGQGSNRFGIGARVETVVGSQRQRRDVDASGYQSQSQTTWPVHFGLANAAQVDELTVRWPSGTVQQLTNVSVNQVLTVIEPSSPSISISTRAVLPGETSMDFVWIEPGIFTIGSPASEPSRGADEGPQHEVTISKGFYLGQYELTQAQWEGAMGTQPWANQANVVANGNHPAVHISWDDVQTFINQVNQAAGETLYRLPTEAEWEYAARAGTTMRWSFGDEESQVRDYAWYDANTCSAGQSH